MPTVINTNLASLFAQNSLTNAQNNLAQSVQRLSSGLRINSAKDDAAGLAIAQLMQSNINGVNQSIRNMSNATNLLQTADTALATVQDMLLRMKQLSVQGYDGSISTAQRINIVTELKDLRDEINATANRTTFNNINLIGSANTVAGTTGDVKPGLMLTQASVQDSGTAVGQILSTARVDVIAGQAETARIHDIRFNDMVSGDEITIGGLTLTAADALDDEEVALAFANIEDGDSGIANPGRYSFSGTLSGFSTGLPTGGDFDTVRFTATAKGSAVGAISITDPDSTIQSGAAGTAGLNNDNQVKAQYIFNNTDSTSDGFKAYPGRYTFSNNYGDNRLTLSGYVNGTYKEQTLVVDDVTQVALDEEPDPQYLNFSTFGITLNLTSIVGDSDPTILGSAIVDNMDTKFIDIAGESARITNINVSGAEAGNYRFSGVAGAGNETKLRLDYENPSDPGGEDWVKTAIIDLADTGVWNAAGDNQFLARQSYRLNFESLGISLDIHAFQDMDSSTIVDLLADSGGSGDLIVSGGSVNTLRFQSGPNSDSFIQINTLDIKTTDGSGSLKMQAVGADIDDLSDLAASYSEDEVAWQAKFTSLDSSIEAAQVYISQERAVFGSQMNRVGYLSTNLTSQSTNLQNSRSSIIDTDFAAETAKLTRGQIMQQAATAMLAQANQMPNVVLSLLK